MTLKDSFDGDNELLFNLNEFASECTWGTRKITAVIDDEELISKYSEEYATLPQYLQVVIAKCSDFIKKPAINSAIRFNNELYTINKVTTSGAIYIIYLEKGQ